jgi:cell shape-determining protein MreC
MSWQVIEFLDENPNAGVKEIINHFAEQLNINDQIQYLKEEVEKVLEIRVHLRPLYAQKMEVDQELIMLDSEFDMEVMTEYPPRKGSDKERKAYKQKLQQEHVEYQNLQQKLGELKEEIEQLEQEMDMVQQNAKNARKLVDLFNTYIGVLLNGGLSALLTEHSEDKGNSSNTNVF